MIPTHSPFLRLIACAAVLAYAIHAPAVALPQTLAEVPGQSAESGLIQIGDNELLHKAYHALALADHDYKGHRAKAMKQTEDAVKELGSNVSGDGKGHETQGLSDDRLREARGLLERARGSLAGKTLKHVNDAIAQIDIALKIK